MDLAKYYFNEKKIIWTFDNINNVLSKDKNVYLTIDDVINNDSFEEILDVLDEFNAKATFFVISSYVNEYNKNLLVKAIKSGHHLANHGKTNCAHYLCDDLQIHNEIMNCEKLIENIYYENNIELPKIKYYRPGHGYVSNNIIKICEINKYKIVLGSVYPSDTKLPFPNLLFFYLKNKIKPNDIIILHDRKWTPSILKKTLLYLKNNNYKIKSLI